MGHTANLFHSGDVDKATLNRRARPSDAQFEQQQERWNELAEYLKRAMARRTGYIVSTWLQGSYKFGTQVRPPRSHEEFDIDLGLYLAWDGSPASGDHDPGELRRLVQNCLEEAPSEIEGIVEVVSPPKARCCRVRYDGGFHIDIPVYHLHPTQRTRTLATDDGWEQSDPEAIYNWWCAQFADYQREKARRLVRYLKVWARLKFTDESLRPSAILLTVLVAHGIAELDDSQWASDDDGLRSVTATLVARLRRSSTVPNPVTPTEDLAGRLTADAQRNLVVELERLLSICDRALSAPTQVAAAGVWQEAFGHFFPMPEAEVTTDSTALTHVNSSSPNVRVRATLRKNSSICFRDDNRIGPIPRDCSIEFEVADPWMLPQGATVEWTVRNDSEEAEDENDLGHVGGTGLRATERSAYVGTHYMDCVVKVGGHVVGHRRIQVVIEGNYLSRRQRRARR